MAGTRIGLKMTNEILRLKKLGLGKKKIAQALGIPRGTVESRIFRARAALKLKLRSYE